MVRPPCLQIFGVGRGQPRLPSQGAGCSRRRVARVEEGAPWTEPFAGGTVEGGRCAPGFFVWTEQGTLASLYFFARALERDGTIPSREGCIPARDGRVPEGGPPR